MGHEFASFKLESMYCYLHWRDLERFGRKEEALLGHSNHGRQVDYESCIILHEKVILDDAESDDCYCDENDGRVRHALEYGSLVLEQIVLESF